MDHLLRKTLEREMVACEPSLRAYARSLCMRKPVLADDLVQDTFVLGLRHLDSYKPGTSMRSWLMTVMRNRFLSDRRREWRMVEDPEGHFERTLSVEAEQHQLLEDREAREASKRLLGVIKRLLRFVPEAQRNAFWMVHAEGHSYQETADIQHCKIGTVKSRVHRALVQLLGLVRKRGLSAEGITAEQWRDAFADLSMKVTPRARVAGSHDHDLDFCGLKFDLVETVRFAPGPSTQIFRLVA